jgi:hypothetical protein
VISIPLGQRRTGVSHDLSGVRGWAEIAIAAPNCARARISAVRAAWSPSRQDAVVVTHNQGRTMLTAAHPANPTIKIGLDFGPLNTRFSTFS